MVLVVAPPIVKKLSYLFARNSVQVWTMFAQLILVLTLSNLDGECCYELSLAA